jgi:hypothetical protein
VNIGHIGTLELCWLGAWDSDSSDRGPRLFELSSRSLLAPKSNDSIESTIEFERVPASSSIMSMDLPEQQNENPNITVRPRKIDERASSSEG